MKKKTAAHIALTLSLVAICIMTGCSSVPLATKEADQSAKQFQSSPDHALIYVFRDQALMGAAVTMPLFLDGKLIGGINDYNFRALEVEPGKHQLGATSTTTTGAVASLPIEVQAGQLYFVRATSWPRLMLVSADEGKKQVRKCKLAQAN